MVEHGVAWLASQFEHAHGDAVDLSLFAHETPHAFGFGWRFAGQLGEIGMRAEEAIAEPLRQTFAGLQLFEERLQKAMRAFDDKPTAGSRPYMGIERGNSQRPVPLWTAVGAPALAEIPRVAALFRKGDEKSVPALLEGCGELARQFSDSL